MAALDENAVAQVQMAQATQTVQMAQAQAQALVLQQEVEEENAGGEKDVNGAMDGIEEEKGELNGKSDEDEEMEEDDDMEESDDEEEESEEESLILESRLRRRHDDKSKVRELAREEREVRRQLAAALRKPRSQRLPEEAALLRGHPRLAAEMRRRAEKRRRAAARKLEIEDPEAMLERKCATLATAISRAKSLVAYTGAGISTAANIPDYRGPNGVWTLMDQGKRLEVECDPSSATPTYTHRALFTLFKRGKLKHVVSQNCDGLHMRSGIPRAFLSEIHGNMFMEICKKCRPARPFVRLFDVTERTNKNRHATMRRCYVCGTSLTDTIVHFGEKGALRWPINWNGATKAAQRADVILCLGSSLKVMDWLKHLRLHLWDHNGGKT